MSRFNLIVVILVILQIVLLRGYSCVPVQDETQLSEEVTKRLKKIGEEMKDNFSVDKDPCTDFYGYVCDKSRGRLHLHDYEDVTDVLENYLHNNEKLSNAEEKLKTYIETCRNYKNDDVKNFVRDFNFPDTIRGWPAYDPNWNADKFDWKTAMAELKTYFTKVILDQEFDVEPVTFKKHLIVRLENFELTQENKKNQLLDKISTLGITNADKIFSDAMQLEKECKEVISAHKSNEEKKEETNFAGLKQKIPEIDWDKQMEIIAGEKLKDDFIVVIKDVDVLRKVIDKISEMDPKIVANYLFCSFVNRLPNLSEDNLKDKCARHALKDFPLVVSEIFFKKYFTGNLKVVLSGMIESLMQHLQNFTRSLDGTSSTEITENIEHFINEEYLPSLSDENLNKEYENIEIDTTCSYRNTYNLHQHQQRIAIKRLFFGKDTNMDTFKLMLPWLLPFNLYLASNQPSFDAYIAIALEPMVTYLKMLGPGITELHHACFLKPLEDPPTNRVIGAKLFIESYFDWANKNKDLVQAEDEILRAYDLTSRKMLFIGLMQFGCEYGGQDIVKNSSLFFGSMNQFLNTFNCPADSPMNPMKKCDNNA